MAPLESVSEKHFHKHFDLNVLGVLPTSREAFKYFGPAQEVSSTPIPSSVPDPMAGASVYRATKGGRGCLDSFVVRRNSVCVTPINPLLKKCCTNFWI